MKGKVQQRRKSWRQCKEKAKDTSAYLIWLAILFVKVKIQKNTRGISIGEVLAQHIFASGTL
eukprot:15190132-Ditylum_brightwellii.AAC.1